MTLTFVGFRRTLVRGKVHDTFGKMTVVAPFLWETKWVRTLPCGHDVWTAEFPVDRPLKEAVKMLDRGFRVMEVLPCGETP